MMFTLTITTANATSIYNCEVKNQLEIKEYGEFEKIQPTNQWYSVGKKFTLNRLNGEVHGQPLENIYYEKTLVISPGNDQQSYTHLTISHGPHRTAIYVYVAEHEPQQKKPFNAVDGKFVYGGICE